MRFRRATTTATAYSAIGPSRFHWRAGLTHLPYGGIGGLLLALVGVIVAVAILVASDGVATNKWKFQPTVYLAIASTLTNVTLAYSLLAGVNISWWHKALKDGTKVGDLHRVWAFGNSFLAAITSGRHVNLVAIASILVAISPVNGPLLQRASTIGNATVTDLQQLDLRLSQLIPKGYTGIVSNRGDEVNMLTSNFTTIAKDYYNRSPVAAESSCTGSCRTTVSAAGFYVNCSTYRVPFNISEANAIEGNFPSPTVFGAEVLYDAYSPTTANLNMQIKADPGCAGDLSVTNCTLRAGTVLYPIVIDGVASTVALDSGTTIWDDVLVGNLDHLDAETHLTGRTTYGGIFLALANQYNTDLQLSFGGAVGYQLSGSQSMASVSYAHGINEVGVTCEDIYFTDPMHDFLQGFRELIFRTSVATANSSTAVQHVEAQASGNHTVYHTDYLFLGLATLASVAAIVVVLFTFHGFWRLGRSVSMSPIETAKAFDAPLLRSADSTSAVPDLLKQVGKIPVKYGLVTDVRIPAAATPTAGDNTLLSLENSILGNDSDTANGASPQDGTPAPGLVRTRSTYNNAYGSDFELFTPQETSGALTTRLELADPKRIRPM
ncbi:uncharacterized protein Z518_02631 [Rhinocladiella mackenziei CBS 650.93]|uniref:Uncharacterized protein n=1 Tax=Rhinocladiella mackenziei CBS 650.93 TaxID=1442369 RepID=A0A0D2G0D8_9EURO|nr:uncharacterized protein Z518_02631 [Rhinocladiella mackenziei CBS 650.93]KIX07977.1 hypothetical protein Z518_02631 [Rhinocladiella mackenziei CBS 650.93]